MFRSWYIAIVLLPACGQDRMIDPSEIWPLVESDYSARIQHITPECHQWLVDTRVLPYGATIPDTDIVLSDECPKAEGCHIAVNNRSYIYCETISDIPDWTNGCYAHEYIHAIRRCMTKLADNGHVFNDLWCARGMLCSDMVGANNDSVEFRVDEKIWEMYN
jgi:hypothetical protein